MSAEAPRGNQGCLPGFLRRFVTGVSEPQPISQTKPNVIHPPVGLENFADQIQSVVDGRLTAQRQKEHNEMEAAKAPQVAAEAEARRVAQEKADLAIQEAYKRITEKNERINQETDAILEKFRVVERLEYIRDTVWGGKGEIRPVGGKTFNAGKKASYTYQNNEYNYGTYMGGFELAYQYPSVELLDSPRVEGRMSLNDPISTPSSPHRQKCVLGTDSTKLSIRVLNIEQDSGEDRKELEVFSSVLSSVCFPRETEKSEALLEAALKQETIKRVDDGLLPSQLEQSARKMLTEAQREPNWQKWKEV